MTITIVQYPVERLVPYARNAHTHPEEQIAKIAASIAEFGFVNPILVGGDNVIIAGHGRLLAAQRLGLKEVPVIALPHLTEAQRRALAMADNRIAADAGWDEELLKLELSELKAEDFDLGLTGFSEEELQSFFDGMAQMDGKAGEDDVPAAPEHPVAKPGDQWRLGKHRLRCGDCTKAEDIQALMQGEEAAFCFTSPPYADMRDYDDGFDASLEVLTQFIPAALPYCDFFAVNLGLSRKDGRINRYWDAYISAAEAAGLPLTAWNVWSKQGMGGSVANLSAMFPIEHEWILIFGGDKDRVRRTKKNKLAGQVLTGSSDRQKDGSMRRSRRRVVGNFGRMGSIYVGAFATGEKVHPAAFPVHLPREYINACSHIDDIIYEPFGGSGTTLIACEEIGRACRIMELSPRYCDVIIERWQDFTGGKAVLEKKGKTAKKAKM